MLRHRIGDPRLLVALLAALILAPVTAAAQLSQTGLDGITRTEADLGTWDAVLVAGVPGGSVATAKGVEINTRGCDGRCIVTTLEGALATKQVSGQRAWWDIYDSAAGTDRNARLVDNRTGLAIVPYGPDGMSPGAPASTFPGPGPMPNNDVVLAGAHGSRTSVARPSSDERVVTLYRQQPNGTENALFVVTYTRRK